MPQDLKPLTALRFFAAMWVVLFDFTPSLGQGMPAIIAKGYLGVELFFVLSGFIISHVYMERLGTGQFHYGAFLWARLARIYPVHVVTLIGLGLIVISARIIGLDVGDKILAWSSLPAQLTLTHAWGLGLDGGWNHPSWSISAEWFAYLSFPAFAAAIWPLRAHPRLAVGLAALALAAISLGFQHVTGQLLSRATIAWGALRIVPCFGLGCAVWLLWRANSVVSPRIAGFVVVLCAGLAAAACASFMPDWLTVLTFGGLIFGLATLSSSGSPRLTAPVWIYLGEISFSIYMVCIPWQLASGRAAARLLDVSPEALPWPIWIAQVLGVILVGMLAHHLVERPARDAMRRHPLRLGHARAPKADSVGAAHTPFLTLFGTRLRRPVAIGQQSQGVDHDQ